MLKSVALEALLVTLLGVLFALALNAISPRGLRLTTDYFATLETSPTSPATIAASTPALTPSAPADAVEARLRQRGLQSIAHDEVAALVQDSTRDAAAVLLIDARSTPAYTKGHLPGAWQLDPYRAEHYLPDLLPRCLAALKVVIYCTGGECEDSELAAIHLRDAGVPNERLYIYAGGMQAWTRFALPVESGPSRLLRP